MMNTLLPPCPQLLRQIGEEKWTSAEAELKNKISQGNKGMTDITVETYYGHSPSCMAWKFVVKHDSQQEAVVRETWSRNTDLCDGMWQLRNVYAPHIQ